MKRCWKCAEEIQDAAIVCRFCQAKQGKAAVQPPSKRSVKATLIGLGGVVALLALATIYNPPSEREPAVAKASSKARPPYGGCLMRGLNNQSYAFAQRVKDTMRNPDSFDHVRTHAGPVINGSFPVTMIYRGTNGFGAVDTATASGEIRVSDCAVKLISLN